MALGKRIRYYRDSLGLTLEALADMSEVDIGTISALENRDSQRSKYAAILAKALGLTVEQLLDDSRDWLKDPAKYPTAAPPRPVTAYAPDPRVGRLAHREVEAIIALRSLSQKSRDRFMAQLMQAHEEATQFATEVLAKHGAKGRVSDSRAAETLPDHPDGLQPDSTHGALTT